VEPPAWLRAESERFFGSSSFDYCVYATSLGYLDLCVSSYTVTDKRASVVTFFETYDDPIYLVTYRDDDELSFGEAFLMVFRPFTPGVWFMIVCFVLPVLGLLMLFHERGAPGSAYPDFVPALRFNPDGTRTATKLKVPMWKNVISSLYMGFLAFFNESYDQAVVSTGGKINLLAISSFVMLVLAVYTANLAAILTGEAADPGVHTIDDAVKAGYNFCSERKVAEIVMELYEVSPDQIVSDPTDLGGDGRPGFNCPQCSARQRVFDQMRRNHDDPSLYCNAAFASIEDLEVLQSVGAHCDKDRVGEALVYQNSGIPVSDRKADAMLSLFHQIKNDGVIQKEMGAARPESKCEAVEEEGNSLSIKQLTGIWVVSFSFAMAGLLVKGIEWCSKRFRKQGAVRQLQRYDQWGNPTGHEIIIGGEQYDPDETLRELHEKQVSKLDLPQSNQTNINGTSMPEDLALEENGALPNRTIPNHQAEHKRTNNKHHIQG